MDLDLDVCALAETHITPAHVKSIRRQLLERRYVAAFSPAIAERSGGVALIVRRPGKLQAVWADETGRALLCKLRYGVTEILVAVVYGFVNDIDSTLRLLNRVLQATAAHDSDAFMLMGDWNSQEGDLPPLTALQSRGVRRMHSPLDHTCMVPGAAGTSIDAMYASASLLPRLHHPQVHQDNLTFIPHRPLTLRMHVAPIKIEVLMQHKLLPTLRQRCRETVAKQELITTQNPEQAWHTLLEAIAEVVGLETHGLSSRAKPPKLKTVPDDACHTRTHYPHTLEATGHELQRTQQLLRQAQQIHVAGTHAYHRVTKALKKSTYPELRAFGRTLENDIDDMTFTQAANQANAAWERERTALQKARRQHQQHSWQQYVATTHPATVIKQITRADLPPAVDGLEVNGTVTLDPVRLPFPQHETQSLDPITAEQVERTLRKMTKGKAVGVDNLAAEQLATLPGGIHALVAAFFTTCERCGQWPAALCAQRVVFLPKDGAPHRAPAASQLRPIVLLPHLLKCWSTLRGGHLKQAVGTYPTLLGGKAKIAVERELIKLLFTVQQSVLTPWNTSGVHLDLTKAFETVPHEHLRYALRRLGVHGAVTTLLLQQYAAPKVLHSHGTASMHPATIRGIAAGCPLGVFAMAAVCVPLIQQLAAQQIPHRQHVDDTTIWHTHKGKDVQKLVDVAATLAHWMEVTGLTANNKT
eukprot:1219277-Amphidinium_carterae.2